MKVLLTFIVSIFLSASSIDDVDKTIELCLHVMKTQIYNDGNKRAAVIYANHYLISKGKDLLVIDYNKVSEFKKHLVAYYEDRDLVSIKQFLKDCIMTLQNCFSNNVQMLEWKYDIRKANLL